MMLNTDYRRHTYGPPRQPLLPPEDQAVDGDLARHGDPSRATGATPATTPAKGVAWVRPTDLATYGAPLVGRGIDFQAELVRRARRSPATTTRIFQRSIHQSLPPTSPMDRREGLSL